MYNIISFLVRISTSMNIITLQDTTIHSKTGDAFLLNQGVYGMAEGYLRGSNTLL